MRLHNPIPFIVTFLLFILFAFILNGQTRPLQDGLVQHIASPYSSSIIEDHVGVRTSTIYQGRCYDFDGTDDYIDLGSGDFNLSTKPTEPEITITSWVYLESTNDGIIASFSNASNRAWYLNHEGGDKMMFILYDQSNNDYILARTSNTINAVNQWIFLVTTYDSSKTNTGINFRINNGPFESTSTASSGTYDGINSDAGGKTQKVGLYNSSYFDGRLYDFRIYDRLLDSAQTDSIYRFMNLSNPAITQLRMDEGAGDTAYDATGRGNHGKITNASLPTFHAVHSGIKKSWLNDLGCYDQNDTLKPIITGNSSVNGLSTMNVGQVKYNAVLTGSNCAHFDGTDDKLVFTELGVYDTLVSYQGTSIPTVDTINNEVTFTAGTVFNLKVGNSIIPFSEGAGIKAFDVSGYGNHGTLTNISTSAFWNLSQDEFHYNLNNGFHQLYDSIKVPSLINNTYFRSDSTTKLTSNPSVYSGRILNGAETLIHLNPYNAPALVLTGIDSTYQYSANDTTWFKTTNPYQFFMDMDQGNCFNALIYSDTASTTIRRFFTKQDE